MAKKGKVQQKKFYIAEGEGERRVDRGWVEKSKLARTKKSRKAGGEKRRKTAASSCQDTYIQQAFGEAWRWWSQEPKTMFVPPPCCPYLAAPSTATTSHFPSHHTDCVFTSLGIFFCVCVVFCAKPVVKTNWTEKQPKEAAKRKAGPSPTPPPCSCISWEIPWEGEEWKGSGQGQGQAGWGPRSFSSERPRKQRN